MFSNPRHAARSPAGRLQMRSQGMSRPAMKAAYTDSKERFLTFAFAGADLILECDLSGEITFAAGAFRTNFGQDPKTFIGQTVNELVTPPYRDSVDAALVLLSERGRIPPMTIRLANRKRSPFTMSGLIIPDMPEPVRLCLSFARQPVPAAEVLREGSERGLTAIMESRLRSGMGGDVGLVEVAHRTGTPPPAAVTAMKDVVRRTAPDTATREYAPGRFGLLSPPGQTMDLLSVVNQLEEVLKKQHDVRISSHTLPLDASGLDPAQAARALRRALDVFSREGTKGMEPAGFGNGLAGYIRGAARQADSLRRAIHAQNFTLVYQPIVTLANRQPHHYEALVRPHPIEDCPFEGPQEFVLLVETLGLAHEFDMAVARMACDAALESGHKIAFNISSQSVQSPAFRAELMEMLTASPARKAGLIIVEMTETAEVHDLGEAITTATALQSLKVPFCLDDFGAGAADIRMLRTLGADIVKLDGSYMAGVTEDGPERAFVAGMADIARAAGVEIVAERVEKEPEVEALRQLGIHFGQGWLFGRPGALPRRMH